MITATIFCWLAWFMVFFNVNPEVDGQLGLSFFYASLGLSLIGTGATLGFFVRFVIFRRQIIATQVLEAFRQSFLFAILVLASLFLSSQNLFNWLNSFFLLACLVILEIFIISYRHSR
jgi:hypothetical protein